MFYEFLDCCCLIVCYLDGLLGLFVCYLMVLVGCWVAFVVWDACLVVSFLATCWWCVVEWRLYFGLYDLI